MEKELKKLLMDCTTEPEFDMALWDFLLKAECVKWIDINEVFSEQQVKWKSKLVDKLKQFIDHDILRPTRDLSFNSNYTKFKIINIEPTK